jgi:hypothetical protein
MGITDAVGDMGSGVCGVGIGTGGGLPGGVGSCGLARANATRLKRVVGNFIFFFFK